MAVITFTLIVVSFWAVKTTKANPTYVDLALNKDPINPGSCDTQSHGQIKLIKDRLGDERLVVCSENSDSKSSWKFLDGRSTIGEYFDPAYDCSDVVDRVPAAKSGIYWIENEAVIKVVKAWCDVTTNGGGYLLVAKKDDPVTWIVPSSNETVYPQGNPHWSSIFGDMKMLDIRIQISTTSRFEDTKADWSFRLANKRPLGKLLVRNYGGCTEHNPGIGDISYVKDLLLGKIVNTQFRCSLFSAHLSEEIGWGMMNRCLKMPCPNGFAIIQYGSSVKIKLDDHGSFSLQLKQVALLLLVVMLAVFRTLYSAYKNASTSGILYSSTSFVGCSDGKCCACYGPRKGTKNYCLKNCTAINGGTVTKNAHTWIWIRSSVPKRAWRKCIEYIKTDSNGIKHKYRINEDTGIEEKGSCAYSEEVRKSGAVLVAPNEMAVKKIHSAPGLLLYRSKDKKLFVHGEKEWNELAMENEIKNEKQVNKKVEEKLNNIQQELKNQKQSFEQKLKNTEQKLEHQNQMFEQKLNTTQQELESQITALNHKFAIYSSKGSCRALRDQARSLSNGIYKIDSVQMYCDMSNDGWTLIARFSNADSKNWMLNGNLWYDRISSFGYTTRPAYNRDMISEAFWKVKGNKFKITRSDDSSHTALLQTSNRCLQGKTFRSKITSYGNFRNRAVWASSQCRGSCSVSYGGWYKTTAGFEKHSCSSSIQSRNYIGFWCDWQSGDGAVMMIGGGGSGCSRADHGIGITEEDAAKFGNGGGVPYHDFGYNADNTPTSAYSLNLWVR